MKELDIATEVACEAGRMLMEALHRPHTVTTKTSAIDPVTEMDQKVEAFIVDHLAAAFPDYGFLTEESPAQGATSTRWIIDPLDGTVNYAHGHPHFAVSIALERAEEIVLGVVYHPTLDEMFTAEKGRGAWCNGRRLRASSTARLEEALLASGSPYDVHERPEPYMRLWRALVTRAQAVRQSGAAALDLCYVAAGRLDGYVEIGLAPWDVAAGSLIVQEAGGTVSNFDAQGFYIYNRTIIASGTALWRTILGTIIIEGTQTRAG
ncbi:MAG: inositol monophosphatase family protein [Ardenticatenia bacterium]|nr:inositol monophosphatase family protein [Ardenticatenia bacterium]